MAPRPEHRKRPNRKFLMVTLIVEAEDCPDEPDDLQRLKDVTPEELAGVLELSENHEDYDPRFEGTDMAIKFSAVRILRAHYLPKHKLTKFEKNALARR